MRILFLSRWFPYPPNNGSKIRILNILRQLALEHDVTLLTFAEETDQVDAETTGALRSHCSEIVVLPYRSFRPSSPRAVLGFLSAKPRFLVDTHSADMRQAIARTVKRGRFDLAMASQLDMAPYAFSVPDVPAVLEELELTHFADASRTDGVPHHRLRSVLTWLKLKRYLRRTLRRFSACTVVSEREARLVRALAPASTRVKVIPNAVEMDDYNGDFGAPAPWTMVYAGSMTYAANFDAVSFLLSSIYPLIARTVPDLSLKVTGRTSCRADLPALTGVDFTGHVADVRPIVARSWVSVVPLRMGGGSRLKILESMALGTPVISSSKGAEGLEVTDGVNIAIGDSPREFADRAIEVLRSSEVRARLALSGRSLVAERYSWKSVGVDLRAVVEDACTVQPT